MALDFPTSPTNGQKYPASPIAGVPTYTWDGEKWTTSADAIGTLYVAKAGDTMSGHLSLPTGPAAANAVRKDYVDAINTTLTAADATLTNSVNGKVAKAGDTMTGDLAIGKATPRIWLNKTASGQEAPIYGQTGGSTRWAVVLGEGTAESGGNAGSNFSVQRFNDSSGYVDTPFQITRSNANASFGANIYCTNGALYTINGLTVGGLASTGLYGDGGTVCLRGYGNNATLIQNGGGSATFLNVANGTTTANGQMAATRFVISNQNSDVYSDGNQSTWYLNGGGCYLNYTKSNGFLYFGVNNSEMMRIQYAGGDLIVGQGWKPGGGLWADNSDIRIKNVKAEYKVGLDAVTKLRPVRYTFIGNDTREPPDYVRTEAEKAKARADEPPVEVPYPNSPHRRAAETGKEFIGLIAQEVESIFPGMVGKSEGYIDGAKVDDMRSLDTTTLVFALVNAVKELKARIEVLEGA